MEKTKNKNDRKSRSILKQLYLIGGFVILILLFGFWYFDAKAKTPTTVNTTVQSNQSSSSPIQWEQLTVWNIIEMNDWFLWPFIALTAYGLILNIHRLLVEFQQKSRSETLLQKKIHAKTINSLIQMLRSCRPNRVSRLFSQIIGTFEQTNQTESINENINQFVASESHSFERFSRVNGFLSESAGALGLLGTVWGIFVTFYSAKLDGPTILRGMSIALITTLTGLIISLVLNTCGTYLYTFSNRQLNLIVSKANELRQALFFFQKKSNDGMQTLKENLSNFHIHEPKYQSNKQSSAKKSMEIVY